MSAKAKTLTVPVSFCCIEDDCDYEIGFNIMDLIRQDGALQCPQCHRLYQFDKEFLDKIRRLREMILAVRQAEDILDQTSIGVTTLTGEIKLPYRLLLTRMTTIFNVDIEGKKVDFLFRTDPLNEGATFK